MSETLYVKDKKGREHQIVRPIEFTDLDGKEKPCYLTTEGTFVFGEHLKPYRKDS